MSKAIEELEKIRFEPREDSVNSDSSGDEASEIESAPTDDEGKEVEYEVDDQPESLKSEKLWAVDAIKWAKYRDSRYDRQSGGFKGWHYGVMWRGYLKTASENEEGIGSFVDDNGNAPMVTEFWKAVAETQPEKAVKRPRKEPKGALGEVIETPKALLKTWFKAISGKHRRDTATYWRRRAKELERERREAKGEDVSDLFIAKADSDYYWNKLRRKRRKQKKAQEERDAAQKAATVPTGKSKKKSKSPTKSSTPNVPAPSTSVQANHPDVPADVDMAPPSPASSLGSLFDSDHDDVDALIDARKDEDEEEELIEVRPGQGPSTTAYAKRKLPSSSPIDMITLQPKSAEKKVKKMKTDKGKEKAKEKEKVKEKKKHKEIEKKPTIEEQPVARATKLLNMGKISKTPSSATSNLSFGQLQPGIFDPSPSPITPSVPVHAPNVATPLTPVGEPTEAPQSMTLPPVELASAEPVSGNDEAPITSASKMEDDSNLSDMMDIDISEPDSDRRLEATARNSPNSDSPIMPSVISTSASSAQPPSATPTPLTSGPPQVQDPRRLAKAVHSSPAVHKDASQTPLAPATSPIIVPPTAPVTVRQNNQQPAAVQPRPVPTQPRSAILHARPVPSSGSAPVPGFQPAPVRSIVALPARPQNPTFANRLKFEQPKRIQQIDTVVDPLEAKRLARLKLLDAHIIASPTAGGTQPATIPTRPKVNAYVPRTEQSGPNVPQRPTEPRADRAIGSAQAGEVSPWDPRKGPLGYMSPTVPPSPGYLSPNATVALNGLNGHQSPILGVQSPQLSYPAPPQPTARPLDPRKRKTQTITTSVEAAASLPTPTSADQQVHPNLDLKPVDTTGGLVTFSPMLLLRYPNKLAEIMNAVRGSTEWGAYVIPSLVTFVNTCWRRKDLCPEPTKAFSVLVQFLSLDDQLRSFSGVGIASGGGLSTSSCPPSPYDRKAWDAWIEFLAKVSGTTDYDDLVGLCTTYTEVMRPKVTNSDLTVESIEEAQINDLIRMKTRKDLVNYTRFVYVSEGERTPLADGIEHLTSDDFIALLQTS